MRILQAVWGVFARCGSQTPDLGTSWKHMMHTSVCNVCNDINLFEELLQVSAGSGAAYLFCQRDVLMGNSPGNRPLCSKECMHISNTNCTDFGPTGRLCVTQRHTRRHTCSQLVVVVTYLRLQSYLVQVMGVFGNQMNLTRELPL